ncbi:MAG: hypothetical protein MK212_11290 [Saprospiraceae bacterium]|nr:hypothetical protein [Saprospiraceae bacterium]
MSFISNIVNSFNTELPKFDSLDEGIDYVMRYVGQFSEDLNEPEFYMNQRWREVRDDVNFQESVLHIFREGGEYWRILDGDIATGAWRYDIGGIIIQFAGKHELYHRVFLNENFFILKKHGDHASKGHRKYFFVAREGLASRREWIDLLEIMYEIYRGNTNYMFLVVMFFVFVAVVVFFSLI